ncbi:MAG: helix-turn-helix transcriptional regulator [Deltaproteobacteria bacterium]|nr:MAG: helix-turn-helix transcriptional regulator [Deltaproteobacteria bacterium]
MENKQGFGHCSRRGRVNRVQKFREAALMAKAELARKAGVSESTVDRIEAGHECRMETKRKILLALGLTIQESGKLFPRHNGAPRQRAGDSNG